VPDASNSKLIRGQPICYLPASIMARLKGSREVVRKRINAHGIAAATSKFGGILKAKYWEIIC